MNNGEAIVEAVRGWIGTPFRWEASVKGVGCDCRGLLAGAARDAGLPEGDAIEAKLAGYARRIDEAQLLAGLDRLFDRVAGDAAQAGDVLGIRLRGRVQHLAIHAGGDGSEARMIHAYLGDPARVCEVPIGGFWGRRIAGVWRWRHPSRSEAVGEMACPHRS